MSGSLPLPNATDFLSFVRNVMGIPASALPDNSPALGWALSAALAVVNPLLGMIAAPVYAPQPFSVYNQATYNLAADNLINWAPDQEGSTYFADLRRGYNITGFNPGVVSSASDGGTSDSLVVPDFMKTLSLSDLQNLKTPYGRQYLSFAQTVGTAWGIS